MICEASFMGGPANGETRAFPGEEPPMRVVFSTLTRNPRDRLSYEHGEFAYIRQVSKLDAGPLWVFVPAP